MIETFLKAAAEVGKEVGKTVSEIGKDLGEMGKNFNPDTKAEVSKVEKFSEKKDFNPDTKAEVSKQKGSDISEQNKVEKISCRNESLEGSEHPETGVPFERKEVENEKNEKVEGVFPVFDSEYDVQLPEDKHQASDAEQFDECNTQLKEAVENDPDLTSKFSEEQLEQIENGDTPDGYTWHHNEEKGKMQLVDSEIHAKTGHTGGKSIWGGGSTNR